MDGMSEYVIANTLQELGICVIYYKIIPCWKGHQIGGITFYLRCPSLSNYKQYKDMFFTCILLSKTYWKKKNHF